MTFKTFTGWQYLLIDAANQFGHDKLTFEERIAKVEAMLPSLEAQADKADNLPLYRKAVMAIRKAQKGLPTGHRVGLDATCSGMQIMSVLTGCIAGATATGLVDPDRRADAYSAVTEAMNTILGGVLTVPREYAKKATMTAFYGSKATPKAIFGEDTPELSAFYQAMMTVAPGAWELLQDLLASWQPYALQHAWKLPDGFDARVKVMERKEVRIEVDELNHASFTYEFYENQGSQKGLANAANVTHSMDAYVLREMHRRCNYDRELIERARSLIACEQLLRKTRYSHPNDGLCVNPQIGYYREQWERSTLASAVILPKLETATDVECLSDAHLAALLTIAEGMLAHMPFPIVTVHDEFTAHPNNLNHVRWHYKEILAEIADSNVLDDILSQLHGKPGTFRKLSAPGQLSALIRQSNYGLC